MDTTQHGLLRLKAAEISNNKLAISLLTALVEKLESKNERDVLEALMILVKDGTLSEVEDFHNNFKFSVVNTGRSDVESIKITNTKHELPLKQYDQNLVNVAVRNVFFPRNKEQINYIQQNIANAGKAIVHAIREKPQDIVNVNNILNNGKSKSTDYYINKYDNAILTKKPKFDPNTSRPEIDYKSPYDKTQLGAGAKVVKNGFEKRGYITPKMIDNIKNLVIDKLKNMTKERNKILQPPMSIISSDINNNTKTSKVFITGVNQSNSNLFQTSLFRNNGNHGR